MHRSGVARSLAPRSSGRDGIRRSCRSSRMPASRSCSDGSRPSSRPWAIRGRSWGPDRGEAGASPSPRPGRADGAEPGRGGRGGPGVEEPDPTSRSRICHGQPRSMRVRSPARWGGISPISSPGKSTKYDERDTRAHWERIGRTAARGRLRSGWFAFRNFAQADGWQPWPHPAAAAHRSGAGQVQGRDGEGGQAAAPA